MASFDPYYIWLGIPPDEQPPDYYCLLGIRKFETNPDVIANAAEQRAKHVRSMHVGARQADSQKLLNEIFAATRVLLDQQRKSHYDGELSQRLRQCEGQPRSPVPAAVPVPPATPLSRLPLPTPIGPPVEQPQVLPSVVALSGSRTAPRRTSVRRAPPLIAGWALGLVLALVACAVMYFSGLIGPQRRDNAATDAPRPRNEHPQVSSRPARPLPPAPAPSDPPQQPKPLPVVVPPDSPAEKPKEVQSAQAEPAAPAGASDSPDEPPPDSIMEALESAKNRRDDALGEAEAQLLRAIDDAIVAAAKAKDAKVVEALVQQKEQFTKSASPPTHAQMTEAFAQYLSIRKQLFDDLKHAYEEATLAYAEKLMTAESQAVTEEGKSFSANENAELDRLAAKPKGVPSEPVAALPELVGTPRLVNDFLTAYDKEVERARLQETAADFEQVMQDLPTKMDQLLKEMTWTVRCPIVEIRDGDVPGTYEIRIEAPDDYSPFKIGTPGVGRWAIRPNITLKLRKDQVLSVSPGHYLLVKATPRFLTERAPGTFTVVVQRSFQHGPQRTHFHHFIELSSPQIDLVERPKDLTTAAGVELEKILSKGKFLKIITHPKTKERQTSEEIVTFEDRGLVKVNGRSTRLRWRIHKSRLRIDMHDGLNGFVDIELTEDRRLVGENKGRPDEKVWNWELVQLK